MRRAPILLCWPPLALALAGCATAVSTSSFKGEQHAVAQTVANLQADATAGDEKKICANDLARAVVARLGGAKRCEKAIKEQLDQVDNLEVSVESVTLASGSAPSRPTAAKTPGTPPQTATAQVKGIHAGKHRQSTVSLVKEGGKWKLSGLR